jgi:hypothetical protein
VRPKGEWSGGLAYAQQPLNEVYLGSFTDGKADSIRTFQQAVIVSGELGLSERISLTGAVPLRSVELTEPDGGAGPQASGAGDLQVGARLALTHPEKEGRFSAVATWGVWLPTGASNEADILGENVAFTRGAVTATAGGEFTVRLGGRSQVFGQVDLQYPTGADDVAIRTIGGGLVAARYRFAPSRNGSLVFSRSFAGGRLSWLGGVSQRYFGSDKLDGIPVETRGGSIRRAVAGLVVNVARRQTVGLLAERLLRADVNGDELTGEGQLLARTEMVVAWQGTFGTHRHPAGRDED